MSHSQRCLSANRFGDGFYCICDEAALPRALKRIEELTAKVAELTEQRESVLALAEERVNAANARADAAERVMRDDCAAHEKRCHAAESEAAALRAVAEAHVKDNVQLGEENAALRANLEAVSKAAITDAQFDRVSFIREAAMRVYTRFDAGDNVLLSGIGASAAAAAWAGAKALWDAKPEDC